MMFLEIDWSKHPIVQLIFNNNVRLNLACAIEVQKANHVVNYFKFKALFID